MVVDLKAIIKFNFNISLVLKFLTAVLLTLIDIGVGCGSFESFGP